MPEPRRYVVHKYELRMTTDKGRLEDFLNKLDGEVVAIIPNLDASFLGQSLGVDFLFIVERVRV